MPLALAQPALGNHQIDPSAFASGLAPSPINILLPPNLTPGVIYLVPTQVLQPFLDLPMNLPAGVPTPSTSSAAASVADSQDESPEPGNKARTGPRSEAGFLKLPYLNQSSISLIEIKSMC